MKAATVWIAVGVVAAGGATAFFLLRKPDTDVKKIPPPPGAKKSGPGGVEGVANKLNQLNAAGAGIICKAKGGDSAACSVISTAVLAQGKQVIAGGKVAVKSAVVAKRVAGSAVSKIRSIF